MSIGCRSGGEFTTENGEAGVGGDADFDLFMGNGRNSDFYRARGKDFTNRGMGADATGGDVDGLTGFSGKGESTSPMFMKGQISGDFKSI